MRNIALAGNWSALTELVSALRASTGGTLETHFVEAAETLPPELVKPGNFDLIAVHLCGADAQTAHLLKMLFANAMRPPIFAIVGATGLAHWSRYVEAVEEFSILDPAGTQEIALRIRRLAMEPRPLPADARTMTPALRMGNVWLVESTRYLLGPDGSIARLSFAQARLLGILSEAAGEEVSSESIARRMGHEDWSPQDRSIEVLVRRLRKKVAALSAQPLVGNEGRQRYCLASIPRRCLLSSEFVRRALEHDSGSGMSRLRVEAAVMPAHRGPWLGRQGRSAVQAAG
jgi:DNA-binding response OmpR family regulator